MVASSCWVLTTGSLEISKGLYSSWLLGNNHHQPLTQGHSVWETSSLITDRGLYFTRQFWLFMTKPVFSFLTLSTDVILLLFVHFIYRSPTLSVRDRFQDHQWIPATMDSYQTLYILFPTHTYLWLTYKLGTAWDYPNCQPASPSLLLLLSCFSCVQLSATPEMAAHQAPRPWDSPGKNTEWVAISFSHAWKWKVKVKSLSRVRLLATPWTAA